jgi:hypothetical protein
MEVAFVGQILQYYGARTAALKPAMIHGDEKFIRF